MSASLVGSEMCIRDSRNCALRELRTHALVLGAQAAPRLEVPASPDGPGPRRDVVRPCPARPGRTRELESARAGQPTPGTTAPSTITNGLARKIKRLPVLAAPAPVAQRELLRARARGSGKGPGIPGPRPAPTLPRIGRCSTACAGTGRANGGSNNRA
eukprot:6299514-Alexandrium_andersonii.AAC.1